MTAQRLNSKYPNFFLGGYISNLIDNPDKPYISIAMKSYDEKSSDTVFIMIFKQAGYGKNKYPNPTATIVKDAFEKQRPIACVYYNDGNGGNKMSCCYTNFSVKDDKPSEPLDGQLSFFDDEETEHTQEPAPMAKAVSYPVRVSTETDTDDEFPF